MGVAAASPASFCHNDFLSVLNKISNHFTGFSVFNKRTGRHLDNMISAVASVFFLALSVPPSFGHKMRVVTKINEGAEPRGGFNDNIAAISSIAAVRAAFGDKFFPAKADAAVAAVAALYKKFGLINESHD